MCSRYSPEISSSNSNPYAYTNLLVFAANICNIISPFPFCICEFVFNRVSTCAPREIFNFSVRSYIIKELKITIILFDFFFFVGDRNSTIVAYLRFFWYFLSETGICVSFRVVAWNEILDKKSPIYVSPVGVSRKFRAK